MGRLLLIFNLLLLQLSLSAVTYQERHSLAEVKEFIEQQNISGVTSDFYNSLTESEKSYLKSWDLNFLRRNKNDKYYTDWVNGISSIVLRKRSQDGQVQATSQSTSFNQCTVEARLQLAACLRAARDDFDAGEEVYCFAKHFYLKSEDTTPSYPRSSNFETKRLLKCCKDAGKDQQVCKDMLHSKYISTGFNEETKVWGEQERDSICSMTNFRACSEKEPSQEGSGPLRLWKNSDLR